MAALLHLLTTTFALDSGQRDLRAGNYAFETFSGETGKPGLGQVFRFSRQPEWTTSAKLPTLARLSATSCTMPDADVRNCAGLLTSNDEKARADDLRIGSRGGPVRRIVTFTR